MSTADKLQQIANNVAAVYAAGFDAGQASASVQIGNISITPFDFKDFDFDDMNGSFNIPHSLGTVPVGAFISSNKTLTELLNEGLTIPSGKSGYTLSATKFSDQNVNIYTRFNGTSLAGASLASPDANNTLRLIYEMTETVVRIKPPAATYPWPNKNITDFTLICIGNKEDNNET